MKLIVKAGCDPEPSLSCTAVDTAIAFRGLNQQFELWHWAWFCQMFFLHTVLTHRELSDSCRVFTLQYKEHWGSSCCDFELCKLNWNCTFVPLQVQTFFLQGFLSGIEPYIKVQGKGTTIVVKLCQINKKMNWMIYILNINILKSFTKHRGMLLTH